MRVNFYLVGLACLALPLCNLQTVYYHGRLLLWIVSTCFVLQYPWSYHRICAVIPYVRRFYTGYAIFYCDLYELICLFITMNYEVSPMKMSHVRDFAISVLTYQKQYIFAVNGWANICRISLSILYRNIFCESLKWYFITMVWFNVCYNVYICTYDNTIYRDIWNMINYIQLLDFETYIL